MSRRDHDNSRGIAKLPLVLTALLVVGAVLVTLPLAFGAGGPAREATSPASTESHGHGAAALQEASPADTAPAMQGMMMGDSVLAPGGPHDLDDLLVPPPPSPPGQRVREYDIVARDERIEVADGVFYDAWTYNGTVPGPVLRATEGQTIRIHFRNAGSEPHTLHMHGIHPANQDGVFEVVDPGETFTYEFPATPYGFQLYHCHATPLKKHVAKGLYGGLIIDPPKPRPKARELVMIMNGFDTDADGENNFYTVNGKAFYYAKYPVVVHRNELVRIYLGNMTEFDAVNSFHLHGNFFTYYPVGRPESKLYTDVVTMGQGERGIIEVRFPHTGAYMFHAHQSEFAELGWMGFFKVVP